MKKTVILACPYLYGLDRCIETNLRFHGFEVINLCYNNRDSYYPSPFSRLKNLYHKYITHDGNYKKALRFSRYQADINRKLMALGGRKAEYALCIRANIYPKEIIAQIRAHSETCINYQWDGIDRFPDIFDYLPYFDRFFVFDRQDAEKYPQYGFQTATNFHFDYPLPETANTSGGIYFLGGDDPSRAAEILSFIAAARRLDLPLDFHIYSKNGRARQVFGDEGMTYLDRSSILSFEQNLQKVQTASAVTDFVSADHQGLSFRIFDAMCYRKKLITSNPQVVAYDFYHPDNILIWDNEAESKLADFLTRSYHELPSEIYAKYGFRNWLHYLLDIPPYQPLDSA
ncbi:CgeB family protein [Neisseria chenwenguii]|uniref:hypothetical protein n=1 Tax=Neisseria chenwenguii TaxID=1853278 RepID=UPI000F4D2F1B|nr:hypothetical protein [Neisseria chenwenguii]ROV56044.1 hypothetical protein EGS38_06155 [Neisseria chenwenguii]